MKQKYNSIFFCSAYNDISHIIALVYRKPTFQHLIIVVDSHVCFKFICSLLIKNIEVIFIETKLKKLKNPFHWVKEWLNIRHIRKTLIGDISNTEVYFFASFIDLLTCYCIDILKARNRVYLSIPLDKDFQPTKTRLLDRLLSILYGVNFATFNHPYRKMTGLPFEYLEKYIDMSVNATEEELLKIRKQFAVRIGDRSGFILLLDASADYTSLVDNFRDEVEKIFAVIEKFNIYLKGHPRLGFSEFAQNRKFNVIESYIPSEFVDLTNCRCAISVWSIALANTATMGVKSISLLKLLPYADEKLRQTRINYLEQFAPSKILYPETLEELEKELMASFQ